MSTYSVPAGLCGGIRWRGANATLTVADESGYEHESALEEGRPLRVRLGSSRFCVGVRQDDRRRCPHGNHISRNTSETQCRSCAATDPGRAIARDAVVDPRPFHLYLAWFGPGLLKVGITTVGRGHNRLAEQGALAFTWLAQGPHEVIREAERAIAAARLAPERRKRTTKLAGLWDLPPAARRRAELEAAYQQAVRCGGWPSALEPLPFHEVEHTEMFGLDRLPSTVADITTLTPTCVLAGSVRTVVGTELVLDTDDGPTMLSGRLLAGWPLQPTDAAPVGYRTTPRGPGEHVLF
ncbi:Protein of unknown function [Haloechinothrix alba]|uniref:DUF2797 domain-containing protein n=1 Tax=Haloechinothrix alba TaxID=664784 RepID=A0A238XY54_9PSEU|nr:DUF2797 domain-containing protein [Haloechinothrix alba]SNR63630.1 Protein of unknown function [Haloechinothrix alba]